MKGAARGAQIREQIAREAGRIMVEGGIADFHLAKRKAAARLNLHPRSGWPRNDEVERAAREYRRLFHAESERQRLAALRRAALEAMRFLGEFRPRLVGAALDGGAAPGCAVCLHLFSDPPEAVGLFLDRHGVAYSDGEERVRIDGGEYARVPACRFIAGEVAIELLVFSARLRRRAPLSPVDGRPLRRAGLATVEALVAADGER